MLCHSFQSTQLLLFILSISPYCWCHQFSLSPASLERSESVLVAIGGSSCTRPCVCVYVCVCVRVCVCMWPSQPILLHVTDGDSLSSFFCFFCCHLDRYEGNWSNWGKYLLCVELFICFTTASVTLYSAPEIHSVTLRHNLLTACLRKLWDLQNLCYCTPGRRMYLTTDLTKRIFGRNSTCSVRVCLRWKSSTIWGNSVNSLNFPGLQYIGTYIVISWLCCLTILLFIARKMKIVMPFATIWWWRMAWQFSFF